MYACILIYNFIRFPIVPLFSVFLPLCFFLAFKPKCGLFCGYKWSGQILDNLFLIPSTIIKPGKSPCCPLLYGGLRFSFPLHEECRLSKSWFIWRSSLVFPSFRSHPLNSRLCQNRNTSSQHSSQPGCSRLPEVSHFLQFSPLKSPCSHASLTMNFKIYFLNYLIFSLFLSRGLFRASPLPVPLETEVSPPFLTSFLLSKPRESEGCQVTSQFMLNKSRK